MQKINREKADTLTLVPLGKKHPVRASIEMMQVGELLRIEKADFKWHRRTPGIFVKAIEKKTSKRYKIFREPNMGWLVERVE